MKQIEILAERLMNRIRLGMRRRIGRPAGPRRGDEAENLGPARDEREAEREDERHVQAIDGGS